MELLPGIEIRDLALLVNNKLIISDTQIGYEEYLNYKGIMVPRTQILDQIKRLDKIVQQTKPKQIIINGDIKHEFGTISKTEWRNILKFIDFCTKFASLSVIRGNHDTILEPVLKKRNIKLLEYLHFENIFVCHGHAIPDNNDFNQAKIVVIGHEHPAIILKDKGRSEKFKCFLNGKFNNKHLIVLPSFNLLTQGTDILTQKLLSPFLTNIDDFEVFIVSDTIRHFGAVKKLRSI